MMATEYRRDERHVYRQIAGEHLLISMHRDAVAPMFAFTPTAAELWGQMAEWTTPERLAEHLTARFEVDRDQAAHDVQDFLGQLESIGALQSRETR